MKIPMTFKAQSVTRAELEFSFLRVTNIVFYKAG